MVQRLTTSALATQNRVFAGSGGVSRENRCRGFLPAFLDRETGAIYPSCRADGTLAPVHLLDGLPEELVLERGTKGCVCAIKASVIAGFVRDGLFYTREQAARALRL
ncbi:MAG: hypothetical protein R3310_06180 [Candidatus Competibacteraceae bacterium]|nr:hypothetical protein [Candidatus Competibacteraceae bacterium]